MTCYLLDQSLAAVIRSLPSRTANVSHSGCVSRMSLLCHHQGYFHGIVRSIHKFVLWLRSEVFISDLSADMVQTKRPV